MVGGVGYELFVNKKEHSETQLDQEISFFVYTHVKEDALELFGMRSAEELDFFKKAISVSGVGPKTALNILSLANVGELKKAISSGEPKFLQKVSGIGKKTAERLVVELKEKFIVDLSDENMVTSGDDRVVSALLSLGFKEHEALQMTKGLDGTEEDLAAKIKQALKYTSK